MYVIDRLIETVDRVKIDRHQFLYFRMFIQAKRKFLEYIRTTIDSTQVTIFRP